LESNLISLILIFTPQQAFPVPLTKREGLAPALSRVDARPDGPLSCADVQSGDIWLRYKSWFRIEDRVDRTLLANLRVAVRKLSEAGTKKPKKALSTEDAQYLVAQVLFISYLEDREIVGDKYRAARNVGRLFDLIKEKNGRAIARLIACLKADFNGDFLEPRAGTRRSWLQLSDASFGHLLDVENRLRPDIPCRIE
jgi:hypothetical protein